MNFLWQMYKKDFDARFDSNACTSNNIYCIYKNYGYTNLSQCDSYCDSESCIFSAGKCYNPCFSGCTLCYGAKNGECLRCTSSKMQFFSYCLDDCPRGYQAHHIFGYLCVAVETSSTATTEEIYVTASKTGRNIGTSTDPFWSLSEAIFSSTSASTIIWVLKGSHYLDLNLVSPIFSIINLAKTNPLAALTTLKISGLMCDESSHSECASEFPTVVVKDKKFSMVFLGQHVVLAKLTFDAGYTLVSGCTAESCTYCPTVTLVNGVAYDDRDSPISAYAAQSVCAQNINTPFVSISGAEGKLEVIDVKFMNFRYRPAAILASVDSEVSLTRTIFENCQSSFTSTRSLNGLVTASCSSAHCKAFTMTDSSVSYLNNGFEYSSTMNFAGFLEAELMKSLVIELSVFEYNFVTRTAVNTAGALITLKNCMSASISSSVFSRNFVSGGLIVLSNENLNFGTKLTDNNAVHIELSDLTFNLSGSLTTALVKMSYVNGDQHNVAISRVTVTDCISLNDALFNFEYTPTSQNSDNLNGKACDDGTAEAKSVSLDTISVSQGYGSVINTKALASIHMKNWSVSNSGERSTATTIHSVVWHEFTSNPDLYVTKEFSIKDAVSAKGLANLSYSYNTELTSVSFDSNVCKAGTAGLSFISNYGQIISRSVVLNRNTSKSLGGCLYYTGVPIVLSDMTFTSNTNLESRSGIVYVENSTATFINFTAQMNKAALSVVVGQNSGLTLTSFKCLQNSNDFVGCVVISLEMVSISLTIQSCTFTGNLGNEVAGVLNILNNSSELLLAKVDITSSTFTTNKGGSGSSVIHVDRNVNLSGSILSSVFESNTALNYGTTLLSSRSGSLLIKDCQFVGNSGELGAAVSVESIFNVDFDFVLTIESSSFTGNIGSSVINMTGQSKLGKLVTNAVTIKQNKATAVYVEIAYWIDQRSSITENFYKLSPGAILFNKATAILTGTTFSHNSGAGVGGALTLTIESKLTCDGCNLTYNEASGQGGVISSEKFSSFSFLNSSLKYNKSEQASIFFGIFTISNSFINCLIQENVSTSTSLMVLITSDLSILNSTVSKNVAENNPFISLTGSNITIVNSVFADQVAMQTPFLQVLSDSSANISGTSFSNSTGNMMSGVLWSSGGHLAIANCTFANIASNYTGIIFIENQSTLNLTNCTVEGVTTKNPTSGFILSYESVITTSDVSFKGGSGRALYFINSDVTIVRTQFVGKAQCRSDCRQRRCNLLL